MTDAEPGKAVRDALRFVILLGFASLFADFTCEGSRSVLGPYLGMLGASPAVIGCCLRRRCAGSSRISRCLTGLRGWTIDGC